MKTSENLGEIWRQLNNGQRIKTFFTNLYEKMSKLNTEIRYWVFFGPF